jgi:hypothetical protein
MEGDGEGVLANLRAAGGRIAGGAAGFALGLLVGAIYIAALPFMLAGRAVARAAPYFVRTLRKTI